MSYEVVLNECKAYLTKNGEFDGKFNGSLVYEPAAKLFMVMAPGDVALLRIDPLSVQDVILIGTKKSFVGSPEDEFVVNIRHDEGGFAAVNLKSHIPSAFSTTKNRMMQIKAELALARMMKSRARVSIEEGAEILGKCGLPHDKESAKAKMESLIVSGMAEGVLDGDTFFNKITGSAQTVSYNVVANFDFKDGVLQIKCPKCGAPLTLKGKEPTGTCKFCGASYAVPTKILDLL